MAGIGEPVRLASFKSGRVLVSRDCPNADAVTVAVQDVGIHSVAISGASDGPAAFASTSKFSSPAVTVIHSNQVQRTYAAIAREGEKDGRVLAAWSRPVESTAEAPEYAQLKFDTRISRIHACAALPDRVVVVHEDGKVSLVSDGLEAVSVQPASRPSMVLESWFFPVAGGFVSAALGDAVVLVLLREGEKAWLSGIVISEDVLSTIGTVELVGITASTIVGASCSESGSFSVLQSSGLCSTFTLSALSRSLVATPLPSPLQLQGLALPTSTSSTGLLPSSLAIHALKDSIVVIVGITATSPAKLALLMWNTEYSILLAERVVALPSPLPSPSDLNVSTSGSTSTHLVITLAGYILGASLTLPRTSNIASVLGAARSTVNWLAPTTLVQDENRASLVERIRKDVQAGRVSQADAAFFRWVETEADSASANAGSTAQGTLASATKAAAKIPFPSAFAAALVEAAFPPEDKEEKKDGPPFASGIVSALIWRGAAGQGMLGGPGGLYGALRRKRDWPIMLSALQHIPNIPEDEIIATIRDLLIPLHPASTDSLASTPLSNAPPLQNALAHLIAYPTSPAPLRLALRAHLRDAEDIVHVLKVLDGWLKRGLQFDVWELEGLQGESWMGNKSRKNVGVSASTGKKKIKGAGMIPALEHILNFTQALLDAHLLTLLQHRPAHSLLRSLSTSLSPLPAHNDALQTLAAPLAPFAAEDALDQKSGQQQPPSAGASWQSKEEWRKQRRAQLAAEAVAIGDYRFEELVL